MKLFIDTADLSEIREAARMGVIDGVTTNPTLVARAGRPFRAVLEDICHLVDGPISAEVVATDVDGMLSEGRSLAALHPNIVVKVPVTANGLVAVGVMASEGIKTNMTLCFGLNQAILAAKAGATYISPFVGRLDDVGVDGVGLIGQIVDVYRHYDLKTQVLTASVRHPMHVMRSALVGAHVVTVPYKILQQMVVHPQTDIGLAQFLSDAKKIPAS